MNLLKKMLPNLFKRVILYLENRTIKVQNIFNQIGWYSFFALFPFGSSLVGGFFLMIEQIINFFQKKANEPIIKLPLVKIINKLNLILLGFLFISGLLSPKKDIALLSALGFTLIFLIFIYAGQKLGSSNEIFTNNYLPVFGITSIMAAIINIFQYYNLKLDRAINIFTGFNGYGTVIILCSGLIIGYLLNKNSYLRYWLIPYLCFTIPILLLTKSRGGWLGFMTMLLTFSFFKRKTLIVFLIICLIIGGIFFVSEPLKERFFSISSTEQNISRIYIWQSTLKMIKDYPIFGVGAGVYPFVFDKYAMPGSTERHVSFAHNIFLQMFAEFGIFGFLLFCIATFIILYMGIQLARTGNYFYQGMLASFVGVLIHQQVDIPIWGLSIGGAFWMLEGLIIGFYQQEFSKPKNLDKTCS